MGGSRRAADVKTLADMRGFAAPVEAAEGSFALLGFTYEFHGGDGDVFGCAGTAQYFAIDEQCLERLGMIMEMAQGYDELSCRSDVHAGAHAGEHGGVGLFLSIGLAQQDHRQMCT